MKAFRATLAYSAFVNAAAGKISRSVLADLTPWALAGLLGEEPVDCSLHAHRCASRRLHGGRRRIQTPQRGTALGSHCSFCYVKCVLRTSWNTLRLASCAPSTFESTRWTNSSLSWRLPRPHRSCEAILGTRHLSLLRTNQEHLICLC